MGPSQGWHFTAKKEDPDQHSDAEHWTTAASWIPPCCERDQWYNLLNCSKGSGGNWAGQEHGWKPQRLPAKSSWKADILHERQSGQWTEGKWTVKLMVTTNAARLGQQGGHEHSPVFTAWPTPFWVFNTTSCRSSRLNRSSMMRKKLSWGVRHCWCTTDTPKSLHLWGAFDLRQTALAQLSMRKFGFGASGWHTAARTR